MRLNLNKGRMVLNCQGGGKGDDRIPVGGVLFPQKMHKLTIESLLS